MARNCFTLTAQALGKLIRRAFYPLRDGDDDYVAMDGDWKSTPFVFFQDVSYEPAWFLFNFRAKTNKVEKINGIDENMGRSFYPVCGCKGLVLFNTYCSSVFFIVNPCTEEKLLLRKPYKGGFVAGMFFHAGTGEYRLLYYYKGKDADCYEYLICSLGKAMSWRPLTSLEYSPQCPVAPITMNGSVHWMVSKTSNYVPPCKESIMIFDTETEKFCCMPHPGSECWPGRDHEAMYLIEMEGKLCFFCIFAKLIHIWVLDHYANWTWVSVYKVSPESIFRYKPDDSHIKTLKPIIINKEELILFSWRTGFYRCHLPRNSFKKIDLKGIDYRRIFPTYYGWIVFTKSFVSLADFQAGPVLRFLEF